MKSLTSKLVILFFVLCAATARSQTLNWGSLTGSDIVDSQGAALDNTFIFQLGTFDPSFTNIEAKIDQWADNWRAFDTATYSYSTQDGGYFTGTKDVQDVASYSSLFAGMTAYLWIRNASGTEHFLATSTVKNGIPEWKFPALDPGCCPNGEVTTWSVSNLGSDVPIWGSQGAQDGGGTFEAVGPFNIQTHAVPEPASLMLAVVGTCFASFRRRRVTN